MRDVTCYIYSANPPAKYVEYTVVLSDKTRAFASNWQEAQFFYTLFTQFGNPKVLAKEREGSWRYIAAKGWKYVVKTKPA